MKKLFLFLLLLVLPSTSFAACCEHDTNLIPEFKVSWFRPYSNAIRTIYAESLVRYDFDMNIRLAPGVWVWTGAGFWKKDGHSERCGISSRICDIPTSLGLKFVFCVCDGFRAFVGTAARYDYLRIKSKYNGKYEHKDKGDVGVAVTGGIHINTIAGVYISPFFEYSRNKITYTKFKSDIFNRSVEVGGFNAGIGIGAWL